MNAELTPRQIARIERIRAEKAAKKRAASLAESDRLKAICLKYSEETKAIKAAKVLTNEDYECNYCGEEFKYNDLNQNGCCRGCEPDVDDRDSPNIFPYKKCGICSERSSCGNYTDDDVWRCEDCGEVERIRRYDEKMRKMDEEFDKKFPNTDIGFLLKDLKLPSVIKTECACGCKGKSCVSCGAHVQQKDQYVLVDRKHIHCLWCNKDRKKKSKKSSPSMV